MAEGEARGSGAFWPRLAPNLAYGDQHAVDHVVLVNRTLRLSRPPTLSTLFRGLKLVEHFHALARVGRNEQDLDVPTGVGRANM